MMHKTTIGLFGRKYHTLRFECTFREPTNTTMTVLITTVCVLGMLFLLFAFPDRVL
jgi:hypothetical protein